MRLQDASLFRIFYSFHFMLFRKMVQHIIIFANKMGGFILKCRIFSLYLLYK